MQKELDANKKIANYTFLGLNVDYTLSGHPAFSYNYIIKVNGKDIQYLVVGSIINGKEYEITYFAQTGQFPVNLFNANKIINSFQVLLTPPVNNNGATGTGSSNDNNNPPSFNNNFNPILQFNNIKDNQSGAGISGTNAGNDTINNTTVTTKTNIPNSQSTGATGPRTNNQSNMGLSSNQPTNPNFNPAVPMNNQLPVANTGISQIVHEGDAVLLNGSKSYDPDGNLITFLWRQIGGPVVKLDDATIATPIFTAPNVSIDRNLVFELTVKDNNGLKSNSIVAVTVKNNVPDAATTSTNTTTSSSNKSQPLLSQSPLSSSSTNVPQDYLLYTNPNYGISLNYKSDWTMEEGKGSAASTVCDSCNDISTFSPT